MENREIKFRAFFSKPNGDGTMRYNISIGNKPIDDLNKFFAETEKDGCIWMQYTGIKDKNGIEIYEGDVIHLGGNGQITDEEGNWWGANGPAGYSSPLVEVKWIDSITGFEPFNNYDCDCGVSYNASKVKVIGNIYENPELLSKLKE